MRYQSFRLQVWRSDRYGYAQWAAKLEDLQDGQYYRFTTTGALLSHLQALLDPEEQASPPQAESSKNDTP